MAVALAMPDVPTLVVNDLNGPLVALAETLAEIEEGPELIARLERSLCAEAVYRRAVGYLSEWGAGLARSRPVLAWAYAVACWLGPNGSAQDDAGRFCVRWGPGGGDPATRLRSATEALDGFRSKLRRFTITSRDGFDVLASIQDVPGVVVYADPPYLRATRGAGSYVNDFTDHGGGIFASDADDHDRLAEAVGRFQAARVLVSYYDDPRLDDLYPPDRWRKVALGSASGVMNATGSTGRERVEVLLVNDGGR